MNDLERVKQAADTVLGRFSCHRADCRDCARFALAEIGSDREVPQPGDRVWLEAVYSSETADGTHIVEVAEMGDEVATLLEVPGASIHLAAALGIESKATTNTGATS